MLLKNDLRRQLFNRYKGVTYNPPYIDGSAGGGNPLNVEHFVNNVDDDNDNDENKFSKILLVLIIVVLFLHLFTDLKIF